MPGIAETMANPNRSYGVAEMKKSRQRDRFTATRQLERAGLDAHRQYGEMYGELNNNLRRTAVGADAGTVVNDIRAEGQQALAGAAVSEAAYGRERRSLGLAAAGQGAVRQLGLARVLAQVDSQNRAGDAAADRQKSAQQFSMQQWGAGNSEAMSTLSRIAMAENDRENQYKSAKAARTSQLVGLGTSLIGAAAGA